MLDKGSLKTFRSRHISQKELAPQQLLRYYGITFLTNSNKEHSTT